MIKDNCVAYIISEQETISKPKIIKNTVNDYLDTVVIDAELQDTSEFNRNNRKYPKDTLSQGLNDEKIKEMIKNKSWVGEAGHPINPTVQRQMSIVHSNISHRILTWRWEGYKVCGHVETLMTDRGKDMRDLIRQELNTAFSLRAIGPVTKSKRGSVVQQPMSIVTYDWVFVPSHKNSYERKIISGAERSTSNMNALSESYCVPVDKFGQCVQYIEDTSKELKLITESLEFGYDNILLSDDLKTVKLLSESNNDELVLKMEDYISNDITNFMCNFRR